MSTRRVFLPSSARTGLEALPPDDALTVETHLDNLALLAADANRFNSFSNSLTELNGRLVTQAGACRVHFTVDAFTRVIFVHVIERAPVAAEKA